jgi:hypothetical protein
MHARAARHNGAQPWTRSDDDAEDIEKETVGRAAEGDVPVPDRGLTVLPDSHRWASGSGSTREAHP